MRSKLLTALPLLLLLSACRLGSSPEDCDTTRKGSISICQKFPNRSLSNRRVMTLPIYIGEIKITEFSMPDTVSYDREHVYLSFSTRIENASSLERSAKFDFCDWRSAAVKLIPSGNFYLVNCKSGSGNFNPGEAGDLEFAELTVPMRDYQNAKSIELCLEELGCLYWNQK